MGGVWARDYLTRGWGLGTRLLCVSHSPAHSDRLDSDIDRGWRHGGAIVARRGAAATSTKQLLQQRQHVPRTPHLQPHMCMMCTHSLHTGVRQRCACVFLVINSREMVSFSAYDRVLGAWQTTLIFVFQSLQFCGSRIVARLNSSNRNNQVFVSLAESATPKTKSQEGWTSDGYTAQRRI